MHGQQLTLTGGMPHSVTHETGRKHSWMSHAGLPALPPSSVPDELPSEEVPPAPEEAPLAPLPLLPAWPAVPAAPPAPPGAESLDPQASAPERAAIVNKSKRMRTSNRELIALPPRFK